LVWVVTYAASPKKKSFPGLAAFMSRYRLSVEPLEIVVGWDPPLQTFFLQILDPAKDEEEEIIHWVGKRHGELPTVADLDRALGDHAALTSGVALSPELRRLLDEEKTDSAQPTEFQQRVIEIFRQVSEAGDEIGTVDLEDEHTEDLARMESPDERFLTREAYEVALERMEREGIARVEREDNAHTVPPFNTA
jgi:hypothetical protein